MDNNITNNTDSNSPAFVSGAAREALNQYKYEIANEIGVNLKQGYNGDLTSRQAGSIGGEMVKRMIQSQEQKMSGQ